MCRTGSCTAAQLDGSAGTRRILAAPEFKVCKFASDAIITEGSDIDTIHKVCANPACPVHHPKKASSATDAQFKAEQEKHRREETVATQPACAFSLPSERRFRCGS